MPNFPTIRRLCLAGLVLWPLSAAGLSPLWMAALEFAQGATTQPATAPAPPDPERAFLTLDQLAPLPPTLTSAPAEERPLSQRAGQYLRRADELMADERFTEAGRELEKALRSDPNRYEVHRALALAMYRAGNRERAAAHARQAVGYHADDAVSHYILGRIAFDESDYPAAATSFRRARASSGFDAEPDFAALTAAYLARSLESEGYLTAALDSYREFERRAAELPPAAVAENQELASLLRVNAGLVEEPVARLLERLGRPAEAAEALAGVVAGENVDIAARLRYARLLAAAKQFEQALAQSRLIAAQTDDPASYVQLVTDIRTMMGTPRLAIEDVRELVGRRPDDSTLIRAYVELLRRFEELPEAEKVMTDYLAAHPGAADIAWALCDDYLRTHRTVDAFALAARTVEADPESHQQAMLRLETLAKDAAGAEAVLAADWPAQPVHQTLLGSLALRVGRVERGVNLLRAAIEAAPDLIPARAALAEQWVKEYRWKDAIELVEPYAEKNGNLEWLLGQAYAGLDEHEKAADHYSAAIRMNRADTRAMFALAQVYEHTQRPLRAQRQYEAILRTDPLHEAARENLIRLLLGGRQVQEAQAHLAELRKLNASPNRIARCAAQLVLSEPEGSLDEYRRILTEAMKAAGPDPDSLVLIAASHFTQDEMDMEAAAEPLHQALQIDPTHVSAREMLIPVHVRQLRYADSAEVLRALLRRHPNRVDWVKSLADVLTMEQDYDAAAAVLTDFLDRGRLAGDTRSEFRQSLLDVLESAERHADRIAYVQKWLAEDESDSSLRAALINAHLAAKEPDAAVQAARRWYEAAPDTGDNAGMYRETLLLAERFATAQQLFLAALEQDPTEETLLLGLVRALSDAKQYDDALEVLSSRLTDGAAGGRNLRFLLNRLFILEAAKRYDEAIALLNRMIRDDTLTGEEGQLDEDELRRQLARLLFNAERYNEAQTKLTAWIERTESEAARFEYLRLLSLIYQQRNQPLRALESLEMAYRLFPNAPEINNDYGYSLAEAGVRLADAEKMVRLAVGRQPRNSAYLDSLGWVYYRRGDFKEAHRWLTKATSARDDRDDPVIFDHLGDASWQILAREEAVEHWKKAVMLATERLKDREDANYRRVMESATKKLEAVEANEPPPVAEVVKEVEG